jgi:hypothetical protein
MEGKNFQEIGNFIDTFFKGKDRWAHYFQLFEKDSKKSATFRDPQVAAKWVAALKGDAYFSVGTYGEQLRRRGKREDVVAINALHLDVDVGNNGHEGKKYPPTFEDAKKIVDEMGPPASLIINTGNGWHVYWLLKAPLEDMPRAKNLLEQWNRRAIRIAQKYGWTLDSVHDCCRLMRIPGTYNCKDPKNPKLVTIKDDNGRRYGVDELEEYCDPLDEQERTPTEPTQPANSAETSPNGLTADPAAEPPPAKLDALLENLPEFKDTWRKARPDLPSASEHDWSIVSNSIKAGFTTQEAVNTCIAWRRRHNENPEKITNRQDYFDRLVKHAECCRNELQSSDAENELFEYQRIKRDEQDLTQYRGNILERISNTLKFNIQSFYKYIQDPATYLLKSDRGEILIGPIKNLTSQREFRNRVAEAINHVTPEIKPKRGVPGGGWNLIVQSLLDVVEEVELSPEQTAKGAIKAELEEYLSKLGRTDDLEEACQTNLPYVENGRVHIRLSPFIQWVRASSRPDKDNNDISRDLRRIGATAKSLTVYINETKTSRSMWMLPEMFQ